MFQTEVEFSLPKGYVDASGDLHKTGVMRLATAADEILPMRDQRVQANPAYLSVIVLSRVITRLGTVDNITPRIIEGLFAEDFAFLQHFYEEINAGQPPMQKVTCPKCDYHFIVDTAAEAVG